MDVTERFRAWVAGVGSQQKAADILGVRQSAVAKWMLRKRTPTIESALRIERATAEMPGGPIRVAEWAQQSESGEAAE